MITSNSEFLQAVFGDCWQWAHVTGFAEDPAQLDALDLRHYWGGNIYYYAQTENQEHNNFFVISTFNQDPIDGKHRRRKNNHAATFCMMIDDIGSGPGAKIDPFHMGSLERNVLPSWEIETSPDNYQYGYIFSVPETNPARVNSLLRGLVAKGFVDGGEDPGMLGVTRYARLPFGSNTKAKYGQPFRHRLAAWNPDRRYTIDEIAADFDINLEDHDYDAFQTAPLPEDRDLVLQSLTRLGLVKGKLREGIYDVVCPWIGDHSDRADSGAAYLSPMGFKCHHGHCATRVGRDLLNYLHGADPVYAEASKVDIPFVAQEAAQEPAEPVPQATPEFKDAICEAINNIDPNNPDTFIPAFECLAAFQIHLLPSEVDHWLRLIKDEAAISIKVARDTLKKIRSRLLQDNKKRGILQEPAWVEFDGDKIIACLANFRAICEYHGITMMFNQMAHSIDVHIPGVAHSTEDLDNLNLTYLRDLVTKYNINHGRVDEWMLSYAHEHPYHPFRDYLDQLREFHGLYAPDPTFPTFYRLLDTLDIADHEPESREFIRRWLISVVAAVRGSGRAGLKGVLTLAGGQGIGKTSWLRALIPPGMFLEGMVLDVHDKDTIIKATNYLVCELGELDATFKRDIPALKAFISNREDEIRHPYAKKSSKHPRRTVFCASVNQSDFLVDQTGNSRFWPVSVNGCDFRAVQAMNDSGEIDRLWHEIDMMYEAGCAGEQDFVWWIEGVDAEMLDRVSESYIKQTQGEILLRQHFDFDGFEEGGPLTTFLSNQDIMDVCGMRSKDAQYAQRSQEVFQAIRRITGQKQQRQTVDGIRKRGYKMPRVITQAMVPSLAVVPQKVEPTQLSNNQEYEFL